MAPARWLATGAISLLCGCAAAPQGPARIALALDIDASPDAVKLLGFYAFAADLPGLRCETYLEGDYDPFDAFGEEELAGISFLGVPLDERTERFDGITPGSRVIIVEGYDGAGRRLFLGCAGPIAIDPGETSDVEIRLVEDPELS